MTAVKRIIAATALLAASLPLGFLPIPASEHDESSRLVGLEGTKNFRDLGGIETNDGRRLKDGLLFRSDRLSDLTKADQAQLRDMGVRYVVDFRTTKEKNLDPDNLDELPNVDYVHLPLYDTDVPATTWERMVAMMSVDDLSQVLVESNENLVREGAPGFRRWFELLLADQTTPMVFHCSGGKDRTGLASALLLTAMDVPQSAIFDNYLATNDFVGDEAEETIRKIEMYSLGFIDAEDIAPIFLADRRYLGAAFRTIAEEYGGMDAYLESELGLDRAKREALKSRYLE